MVNRCGTCSRICSTYRKHFPVLSSLMTYHRVCSSSSRTGTTSGAGSCYPILSFMCNVLPIVVFSVLNRFTDSDSDYPFGILFGPFASKTLNYMAFQSFYSERTWWTCSGEASSALIYISTILLMWVTVLWRTKMKAFFTFPNKVGRLFVIWFIYYYFLSDACSLSDTTRQISRGVQLY